MHLSDHDLRQLDDAYFGEALARAGAGAAGQGTGGSEGGARTAGAEPVEQLAPAEHAGAERDEEDAGDVPTASSRDEAGATPELASKTAPGKARKGKRDASTPGRAGLRRGTAARNSCRCTPSAPTRRIGVPFAAKQ